MQDLRTILSSSQLSALRAAYDPEAMRAAMIRTIAEPYPPLGPWNEAIAATFYDAASPLKAVDRERCLLAILSSANVPTSLAIHVYWGLMEGLSVEEICHIQTLAACYSGVPSLSRSLPALHETLHVLAKISETTERGSIDVLKVLVGTLTSLKAK